MFKVPVASPDIAAFVQERFGALRLAGAKFMLGEEDTLLVLYLRATADLLHVALSVARGVDCLVWKPFNSDGEADESLVWVGSSWEENSFSHPLM